MHYFGGKFRTRKHIATFLRSVSTPTQLYIEPFVGAANVLQEMQGYSRVAADGCYPLIVLYKHLQQGWNPPLAVSEEEYQFWKSSESNDDPMKAFVGFGCSFAGKWFDGYARNDTKRNYCLNSANSLVKLRDKILDVDFRHANYLQWRPTKDRLIYCDPPYQGTRGYGYFKGFDHTQFWGTVRTWSKQNTVAISEYLAPPDFKCVLEIPTKTDMNTRKGKEPRVERLFMWKGSAVLQSWV